MRQGLSRSFHIWIEDAKSEKKNKNKKSEGRERNKREVFMRNEGKRGRNLYLCIYQGKIRGKYLSTEQINRREGIITT